MEGFLQLSIGCPNFLINDSTMKLFIKTFSFKGNTIDEALTVIAKKRLYSKYFDSQNTDKKTLNDASQGKGSNCVNWGAGLLQNS